MLLLGLLLLVAVSVFVVLLVAYNSSGGPEYTVGMFGNDIATMNALEIFLAGIALALLFTLGLALLGRGAARGRRRRSELRAARRERAQVVAERDDLASRLGESDGPMTTGGDVPRRHRARHLLRH